MACDFYTANVVLGLHCDGTNGSTTFTDVTGKTVTANGNAQISTAQSKFGGASAYFDGAGDYLSLANSTDFDFGSADFTIDLWVRIPTVFSAQGVIFAQRGDNTINAPLWVGIKADKTLRLIASSSTSVTLFDSSGITALSTDTWHHVEVTRSGSAWKVFLNGTQEISATNSGTLFSAGTIAVIGGDTNTNYLNGYIDDLRITKGVARHTANFTAPTEPFSSTQCTISGTVKDATNANAQRLVRAFRRDTAALVGQTLSNPTTGAYSIPATYDGEYFVLAHDTANVDIQWDKVVLAMHMNGTNGSTTFTDVTGKTVTANGNAQISTAQSKFGGASAYFDGAGDYLSVANTTDLEFTGDFTIELWVRFAGGLGAGQMIFDDETASYYGFLSSKSSADKIVCSAMPASASNKADSGQLVSLTSTTTVALNTWYHVAFVHSGTSFMLFVNGVLEASTTLSGAVYNPGGAKYIGGRVAYSANYLNGYIDDLRITKAARYTANFTPPTVAFPEAPSGGTENAVILDRIVPA